MVIFDTFSWPEGKELCKFGEKEITLLLQHLASCFAIKEDDITHSLDELYEFKVLIKNLAINSLFERHLSIKDLFSYLANLLVSVLTLLVSIFSCEISFSQMNINKTKLRSNLKEDCMNSLLFTNLNGPCLKDFNK